MTVEEAYEAYRAGRITYEEYRKKYADPVDAARLQRIQEQQRRLVRRR